MAVNVIKTYSEDKNESVLDAPQETLNPKIWNDTKLKPEVRDFILKTLEEFKLPGVQRISFVGSNTGFQYTDTSDMDIHIWIPDTTEEQGHKFKEIFPQDLKLPGTEIPVQFYVIGVDESKGFEGKGAMYDVEKDEWIIPPLRSDIKVPYSHIMEIAKFFMEGIDNRCMELEADEKELEHLIKYIETVKEEDEKKEIQAKIDAKKAKLVADIDSIIVADEVLYGYRSDAYSGKLFGTNLQMGTGNESVQAAVYKVIEELGYKQKIKDGLAKKEKYKVA
jgi:hypothetical protein